MFSSDRVRDIFDRYTLKTGGTGGQVVSAQQNQGIQGDHLKNRGGIEVVSGIDNNKADVPPIPPMTTYPKTGGRAESLTGQGKAGGIPPIPPKTVVNEDEIFTGSSVENLDIDNLSYEEVLI